MMRSFGLTLIALLTLFASSAKADVKSLKSTQNDDAKAFLSILGEEYVTKHLKSWQENRHKPSDVRAAHALPFTLWKSDDKKKERDYFRFTEYTNNSRSKRSPKLVFEKFRLTAFGGFTVTGKPQAIDKPDDAKKHFDEFAFFDAINERDSLFNNVDTLRAYVAFLYVNDFKQVGNVVLTRLIETHPEYKQVGYDFMRDEHGWNNGLDLFRADVGPQRWIWTLPGEANEKSMVSNGAAFDAARKEWEKWAEREVAILVGDFHKTWLLARTVTWTNFSEKNENVFSWSELNVRVGEVAAAFAGSSILLKDQKDFKPQDESKPKDEMRKIGRNFSEVQAEIIAIKAEADTALTSLKTAIGKADSAKKEGKGQAEANKLYDEAFKELAENFPSPEEKKAHTRTRPALLAALPLALYEAARLFMAKGALKPDYSSCDRAPFAEAAIVMCDAYLKHFEESSNARLMRARLRLSLKQYTGARADFQSLVDDSISDDTTKKEAKRYVDLTDRWSTGK